MMTARLGITMGFLAVSVGCYSAPELPLVDEVPIVPKTAACQPQRLETIRCAIDGDTFSTSECLDDSGEVFRMLGIDTPETAKPDAPADCYGNEAWWELEEILTDVRVTLTFDEDCVDIYDRTLAYAWLHGEPAEELIEIDPDDAFEMPDVEGEEAVLLVNEWMLAKGFARVYDSSADPVAALLLGERLQSAENRAKNQGLGLWADCSN
jgi:endonuclease YncB( thermonuclease family)